MTVTNHQIANQTTFNNAFVSKTADSTATGVITLNNTTDVNSGSEVSNIQRAVNETFDAVGMTGEGDTGRKTYSSNHVISNATSHKTALGALDGKFAASGGHAHTGASGDGDLISALTLSDANIFFAEFQTATFDSVSGTSTNVSSIFSTETSGATDSIEGIPTSAPHNRVEVRTKAAGDQIEDGGGQKVYARLTESSGTWTLTYYTNEAGIETSTSLSSQNIRLYYHKVFSISNRPTFGSDLGDIGSLDFTADIVDASTSQRGLVSTGTQSLAGAKTLTNTTQSTDKDTGALILEGGLGVEKNIYAGGNISATGTLAASNFSGSSSGTNSGDITLGTFGSSPAAEGASLSGQVLTLQPADATRPGGITTGTQTFAGAKTFSSTITGSTSGNTSYTPNNHGVLFSSSGNTITVLAPDSSTTKFLKSTGASSDPSWAQVTLASDVTGTLLIANGGTNNGSLAVTAGGTVYTDGSKLVNVGAGTTGQFLQSNGASAPTWATPSAATPGGSSTYVQFNDSGAFGGTAGFVFDKTNVRVGINQATPLGRIHANAGTTSGSVGTDAMIFGRPHATLGVGVGAFIANGSNGTNGNKGQGIDAFVCGSQSQANGDHSFCANNGSTSSGSDSFASGNSCTASGDQSFASGSSSTASAIGSSSFNSGTTASGQASSSHGESTTAQGYAQVVIGRFNVLQGTSGSVVTTDEALIIGNGTGSGSRSNAFSVTRDGIIKAYGSTSGNFGLQAPATVTTYKIIVPSAQGSANSTLVNDGSGNLSWDAVQIRSRVSTQFDKTNTTLANVTGLTATVIAGQTYAFRAVLFVTPDLVGGQKYAIAGTATATNIIYNINALDDITNAYVITSRETALAGSAGQAGSTESFVEIKGTITVNAGGTLTVQFAQNAANGTSSVLVGSTFVVEQIA